MRLREAQRGATSAHGACGIAWTQVVANSHGPAESVATLDNVLSSDQTGAIAEFANRISVDLCWAGPRNNQNLRINCASDSEFAAKLGGRGAIAQLGERVSGRDEVAGSSPAGSTHQIALLG